MPLSSRDAHHYNIGIPTIKFFLFASSRTKSHRLRLSRLERLLGEREQRKEKALVEQTLAEERVLKPTIVATIAHIHAVQL